MKKIIIAVALALVVAMSASAYAEVQNVKVGGDLRTAFRLRSNYDLDDNNTNNTGINGDLDQWYETLARVYVQADLTDNVKVMIRLVADVVWAIDVASSATGVSGAGGSGDGEDFNVELDLAWVELSEFWFSFLTAKIGRQELSYNNNFIIGNNVGNASDVDSGELNRKLAFNAMRYILDFDPLTIDIVYAKIDEERDAATHAGNDEDLIGINANYVFSNDWVGELYFWVKKQDEANFHATNGNELISRGTDTHKVDRTIFTVGGHAEGALYPIDDALYMDAQIAYQFGDYSDIAHILTNIADRDQDALAAQVSLDYTWDNVYQPNAGVQYTFYSGNEAGTPSTGDYEGWDPLYEHQTHGIIYDNIAGGPNLGADSNGHIVNAFLSLQATDRVTIAVDYYHFWLDEALAPSGTTRNYTTDFGLTYTYSDDEDAGDEVDVTVVYDYTEDVQFQLRGAAFFPGDAYAAANDDDAYYMEYSLNVAF